MKQLVDFNIWPKGEPNTGYARYFTGRSYLAPLDAEHGGPVNVTFEPRCRNHWHVHHGAVQVLICVAGRGWYVEQGREPLEMRPGTVVAIPAGAKHWHGAAADSWFQHLTYNTHVEEGATTEWLEPVTDEEYDRLEPTAGLNAARAHLDLDLGRTDPELATLFDRFARGEVVEAVADRLDARTRCLSQLAMLLGCQGLDEFRHLLPAALDAGLTPVEVREAVYQAVAYLGMGRVRPFLTALNDVLTARGIALPLAPQGHTTDATRREAGTQAQVDCFGEGMRDFWQSGPDDSRHINLWLAANCFGDYYTRSGLDLPARELITFCFLVAQGGCEPQVKAHIAGNLHVGNDKGLLLAVLSAGIPYIGYPRTLNALACLREAE